MKKIIFLLFFTSFVFAQTTTVQVKFTPGYYVYDDTQYGISNDATFNQILANNGAGPCFPISISYPLDDEFNAAYIVCPNSNLTSLLNALNNYPTVVKKTTIQTQSFIMADVLRLNLTNPSIGTYTTTVGGIAQTNNTALNTIFQTYNVDKYANNSQVRCNCNLSDLQNALNNLPAVINSTNSISYVILLSSSQFDYKNTTIYPNPFSTTLTIDTKKTISQYSLVDITGKELIKTVLKSELDAQTTKAGKGIFLLKIEFEDGTTAEQKIIKR